MTGKIYGFCKAISYAGHIAKGRVVLIEKAKESYEILTVGVYFGVADNIDLDTLEGKNGICIQHDTDSYQVRVKAVYMNKKGYYIKTPRVEYLKNETAKELESHFGELGVMGPI